VRGTAGGEAEDQKNSQPQAASDLSAHQAGRVSPGIVANTRFASASHKLFIEAVFSLPPLLYHRRLVFQLQLLQMFLQHLTKASKSVAV
jgi:hypothetical protein